MEFQSYNAEKDTISVTLTREEVKEFVQYYKGIKEHWNDASLNKNAIGIVNPGEASEHMQYMKDILASFPKEADEHTCNISPYELFGIPVSFEGLLDTSIKKSIEMLGLSGTKSKRILF